MWTLTGYYNGRENMNDIRHQVKTEMIKCFNDESRLLI